MKDWPNGFHKLLNDYIDNPTSSRGDSGINKHFRDIHERLHKAKTNRGIKPLKSAFDEFIQTQWPGAFQQNHVNRISLDFSKLENITCKEAACILNCRPERIKKLVQQGQLSPTKFKGKVFYSRSEVQALAELWSKTGVFQKLLARLKLANIS